MQKRAHEQLWHIFPYTVYRDDLLYG